MTNSAPSILAVLAAVLPVTLAAQKPGKTHKLEASPTTVAYG